MIVKSAGAQLEQQGLELYQGLKQRGFQVEQIEGAGGDGRLTTLEVLNFTRSHLHHGPVAATLKERKISLQDLTQLYLKNWSDTFRYQLNEFKILAQSDREAAEKYLPKLFESYKKIQRVFSHTDENRPKGLEPLQKPNALTASVFSDLKSFPGLVDDFFALEGRQYEENFWWQYGGKVKSSLSGKPWTLWSDKKLLGSLETGAKLFLDPQYRLEYQQAQLQEWQKNQAKQKARNSFLFQNKAAKAWIQTEAPKWFHSEPIVTPLHPEGGDILAQKAFQLLMSEGDETKAKELLFEALAIDISQVDHERVDTRIEEILEDSTQRLLSDRDEFELRWAIYGMLSGTKLPQRQAQREKLIELGKAIYFDIRSFGSKPEDMENLLLIRDFFIQEHDLEMVAKIDKKITRRSEDTGEGLISFLDSYRIIREATGGMDMDSEAEKLAKLKTSAHLLKTNMLQVAAADLGNDTTRFNLNHRLLRDLDSSLRLIQMVHGLPAEARQTHRIRLAHTLSMMHSLTELSNPLITQEEYQSRVVEFSDLAGATWKEWVPEPSSGTDDDLKLYEKAQSHFETRWKEALKAGESNWFLQLDKDYLREFAELAMGAELLWQDAHKAHGSEQEDLALKTALLFGSLGLTGPMDEAIGLATQNIEKMGDPQIKAEKWMSLAALVMNSERPDKIDQAEVFLKKVIALAPDEPKNNAGFQYLHQQGKMAEAYLHLNRGRIGEAQEVLRTLLPLSEAKELLAHTQQAREGMRNQLHLRLTRSILMDDNQDQDFRLEVQDFLADWEKALQYGENPVKRFERLKKKSSYARVAKFFEKKDAGRLLNRFILETANPLMSETLFSKAALKLAQDLVDDKKYQAGMDVCNWLKSDPLVGERAEHMIKDQIPDIAKSDAIQSAIWQELKNATIIFAESKEEAFKSFVLLLAGFGVGKLAATGAKLGYGALMVRGFKGARLLLKHRRLGMGLAGSTAEAAGFATTDLLGRAVLNNDFSHLTWGQWTKDFGAMLVTFRLLHLYQGGMGRLAPRILATESKSARLAFGATNYLGQVSTFTAAGWVNEKIGLHPESDTPLALRFVRSAVMDAHMRLAHRGLKPLTARGERALEARNLSVDILQQLQVQQSSPRFNFLQKLLLKEATEQKVTLPELSLRWQEILQGTKAWLSEAGISQPEAKALLFEKFLEMGLKPKGLPQFRAQVEKAGLKLVYRGGELALEKPKEAKNKPREATQDTQNASPLAAKRKSQKKRANFSAHEQASNNPTLLEARHLYKRYHDKQAKDPREKGPKEHLEKWAGTLVFMPETGQQNPHTYHQGEMGALAKRGLSFLGRMESMMSELAQLESGPSSKKSQKRQRELQGQLRDGLDQIKIWEQVQITLDQRVKASYQMEFSLVEQMLNRGPSKEAMVLNVEGGVRQEVGEAHMVTPQGRPALPGEAGAMPPMAYIADQILKGNSSIKLPPLEVLLRQPGDLGRLESYLVGRLGTGEVLTLSQDSSSATLKVTLMPGTTQLIRVTYRSQAEKPNGAMEGFFPDLLQATSVLAPMGVAGIFSKFWRKKPSRVDELKENITADLYSLSLPQELRLPTGEGLSKTMAIDFERGGQVEPFQGLYYFVKRPTGADSAIIEPVSESTFRAYEAWRNGFGFPKVELKQAEKAWKEFQQRANSMGIDIYLGQGAYGETQGQMLPKGKLEYWGGQIVYLNELFKTLPKEVLASGQLREIYLLSPRHGAAQMSAYDGGTVYMYRGIMNGSRANVAGLFLHEIGHSYNEAYDARPDIKKAHQILTQEGAHMGLDWLGGKNYRLNYQAGSYHEFIAELHMMYVATGPQLRQHIQSFPEGSPARKAWETVYTDFRDNLFQGREF